MITIFEGPDIAGKTTIIEYLRGETASPFPSKYFHLGIRNNVLKWHWAAIRRAVFNASFRPNHNVFIDRLWPSEMVYGNQFRKDKVYDPSHTFMMDAALNYAGAIYVWCLPELEYWEYTYRQLREERGEPWSMDEARLIYEIYRRVIHGGVLHSCFGRLAEFARIGAKNLPNHFLYDHRKTTKEQLRNSLFDCAMNIPKISAKMNAMLELEEHGSPFVFPPDIRYTASVTRGIGSKISRGLPTIDWSGRLD